MEDFSILPFLVGLVVGGIGVFAYFAFKVKRLLRRNHAR
jgi:hypothetical protein